jgi:hypothetical protein
MCTNLGQCASHSNSDKSTDLNVGCKTNIKIYLDKQKINMLCMAVEILERNPNSSYKIAKILKFGKSTDKKLFKLFIKEKNINEGSVVKFV